MAETKDIAFKVEIDGVEKAITSVKDLKKALKDAQDAQLSASEKFGIDSSEYVKASKRVSELRDKVDDLKDSTKSLQGSGIERAQQGFSQLGEGMRNLDFDKVKVGFTAMKSAIAAVGIGLIIQLVSYLVENFDKLSKGSGGLAVALRAVGDVVTSILKVGEDMLNWVTDLIGLTSEAARVAEDELNRVEAAASKASNSLNERLKNQNIAYDQNIALLKAAGKETIKIEQEKLNNIIATSRAIIQQIAAKKQATEEDKKLMLEAAAASYNATNQLELLKVTTEKTSNDKKLANYKKHKEDIKAINEKEADEWWAAQLEEQAQEKKLRDEKLAAEKQLATDRAKLNEDMRLQAAAIQIAEDNAANEKRIKDLEDAKKLEQQRIDISRQSLESVQQLTDIFFMFKSNKAKKGSKEEEEIARKQFNVNKALQLGLATIDGFKAITTSLSQSPIAIGPVPNPAGIASLAFASITTAANIAKIAASQFGGGGSISAPSGGGGGSIPSVPNVSAPVQQVNQTTQFDADGNKIQKRDAPIKVYVTETDMTDSQNRVQQLKRQSTF